MLHNCAGHARSPTLGSTALDRICMSSMCSFERLTGNQMREGDPGVNPDSALEDGRTDGLSPRGIVLL